MRGNSTLRGEKGRLGDLRCKVDLERSSGVERTSQPYWIWSQKKRDALEHSGVGLERRLRLWF